MDERIDSLFRIIDTRVTNEKMRKDLPGAYMMSTIDFCPYNKGEVYFIEYITHPIVLDDYKIFGYSIINNVLILHYDQSKFNHFPIISKKILDNLTHTYLFDMERIPDSGSDQIYIYNTKKSFNDIFIYRDTLEMYGSKELERKLGEYFDLYCFD